MKKIVAILTYAFCAFWVACAPEPICPDEETQIKLNFLKGINANTDSASFVSDTLILVQVTALNTDSIFLVQDTVSTLVLPLNAGADQITYLFQQPQRDDSLVITYKRELQLISEDCGPALFYQELQVISDTFDSVALITNLIDPEVDVNFEVYQ